MPRSTRPYGSSNSSGGYESVKVRIETIHEFPTADFPGFGVDPVDPAPPITWGDLLRAGRIEIERVRKTPLGETRATTVYEIIER